MIKGSEVRKADHPIEKLFLDRWSPRAMSGEEIPEAELMSLFEAARWAPSSYNNQPWRILYARRGAPHWQAFFDLMVPQNQEVDEKRRRSFGVRFQIHLRLQRQAIPHAFVRHRRGLGKSRAARLAERLCRPRHARLRLRPCKNRIEDPGRIPSRSDDRRRQTGKKGKFIGAKSKTRNAQRTQETIRNRFATAPFVGSCPATFE